MPIVPAVPHLSHGFGQGDAVDTTEGPGVTRTLEAAAFYNPMVAGAKYIMRDQFPPLADFDVGEYGTDHELWNDNYMTLGRAQSPQEFDAIADRIVSEKKDKQILQSAGVGGLAASTVSGLLSPTVFIPLVGQARGVKGVVQTISLAAAAATADELALLTAHETYSGEEAVLGIAAGTALGGLLGSAAKWATPAETRSATNDLVRHTNQDTGMAVLHENGAIHYTAPQGTTSASARADFPRPSTLTQEARAKMDPDELALLTDIESGKVKVLHESGEVRLQRVTDAPVPVAGKAQGLDTPNVVSRVLNKYLGQLNPVTRTVSQNFSQAGKRFGFRLSDAGLKGEGNSQFLPHANEGTLEARIVEYSAFVGQFTVELGDAFARHIEGNRLPDGELQGEVRARVKAAINKPAGKMSSEEFNKEVFRVAQTGEEAADPNVAKAAKAWETFNTQYREYAKEAFEHRQAIDPETKPLFNEDGSLGQGVKNYVNHVFSPEAIMKDVAGFTQMLTDSSELHAQRALAKDFERHTKRLQALDNEANLLAMTPTEGRQAYANVEEQIGDLTSTPEYTAYRTERLALERELREAKEANAPDFELAQIKQDLKALKESDDATKAMLGKEAQLKKQRRILGGTLGKVEDTKAELLAKADELEVQDLNALDRVMRAGVNLDKRLAKLTDKAQAKELASLWAGVAKAMKSVETQDVRIQRLYNKPKLTPAEQFAAYQKSALFSKRRAKADAKSDELLARIEKAEGSDLEAQRALLSDVQSLNNAKLRDVNARRALREERLLEKAAEYDPDLLAKRADDIESEYLRAEEDFIEKWELRGAEDLDLETGKAHFTKYSQETGEELAEKIQGLRNPIAGMEILGGERGPELARVLDIPLDIKSQFLEQNMEVLARTYSRHMGPDIELYRATGSVNAAPIFAEVIEDFKNLRRVQNSATVRPANRGDFKAWKEGSFEITPDTKTLPFTDAEKAVASEELVTAQKNLETDLRVMVTRLRNQRGLPQNPDGILYRAGRVVKDLNVARYMGSVLPSSVADVARPVMRYGFEKTYSHGWSQFGKGMERIKMSRREARRMGQAWDPVLHNRVQQVMDVMDNYSNRKTLPERLSGFVANKTGLIAGFDRWTAEMKQISASVTMGELSEGLGRIYGGSKGDTSWYKSFLAEHGIDEAMGKRIWAQYNKADGSDVFDDGFRLPNTESWDDIGAKRAMRAAVNRAVDATIVTPGLDRPNWVDENMAYSMLAQFQSFTFASTNRTLLSGAQQSDMALLNGTAFSLAMGAVSYYIWAMSIGGEHLEKANKFEMGSWADEAIARSGLLGALAIPLEVAQKVPATQGISTFGDQATSRRRNQGLLGTALGPSFDFAEKAIGPNSLATNLDQPTASNLHQARLMAPWQNVFWLRQAIDAVESGVANSLNLPERRQ